MVRQLGMDPVVIRGLADQMDGATGDLRQIAQAVDGIVNQMGSQWLGQDCEQLSRTWQHVHRPALSVLADQLHTLVASARTNASDQDQASVAAAPGSTQSAWPAWNAARPPSTLEWIGAGLSAAGVGMTLTQLAQLGSRLGIAIREWEPGVLKMLDDGSALAKAGQVFGIVGIGIDGAKLGEDFAEGKSPWVKGYDMVGTAVDGVGSVVPEVALAKGAWDVGVFSGQEIARIPAVHHALDASNDGALDVGASHVHGDVHTDPKAAADLVKRYSGASGFVHWGEDSVAGLFH